MAMLANGMSMSFCLKKITRQLTKFPVCFKFMFFDKYFNSMIEIINNKNNKNWKSRGSDDQLRIKW